MDRLPWISLCEAQEVGGQIIIFLFSSKCTFQPSYPQSPHKSRYSGFVLFWGLLEASCVTQFPVLQVVKGYFWDFSPLFERREELCYCVTQLYFSLLFNVQSDIFRGSHRTSEYHLNDIVISGYHLNLVRSSLFERDAGFSVLELKSLFFCWSNQLVSEEFSSPLEWWRYLGPEYNLTRGKYIRDIPGISILTYSSY